MARRGWYSLFLISLGLMFTAALGACGPGQRAASTPTGDPLRGQSVFTTEAKPACASCHTIEGVSTGQVGPDLTHIGTIAATRFGSAGYSGQAQDAAGYLRESILTPNTFLAPQCPTGTCFKNIMPQDFGEKLTEQQLGDLIAFLLDRK